MSGRFYPTSLEGDSLQSKDLGGNVGNVGPNNAPTGFSLPSFGNDGPVSLSAHVIDLGTAHDKLELKLSGNVFWAYDATDITSNASIAFGVNSIVGNPFTVRKGLFIRGIDFNSLFVTNTAQTGKTLSILSAEDPNEKFSVQNTPDFGSGTVPGGSENPTLLFDHEINILSSSSYILAGNSNRHSVIFHNMGPGNLYFGGFYFICPGESITLYTTTDITIYSSVNHGCHILILEEIL